VGFYPKPKEIQLSLHFKRKSIHPAKMESWALILLIIAASLVFLYLLKVLIQLWARKKYQWLKQNPPSACDIDAFVDVERNPVSAVKCVAAHYLQVGSKFRSHSQPIPLQFQVSSHVPGLYVSSRNPTAAKTETSTKADSATDLAQLLSKVGKSDATKVPIVVCTIRMGFGHHRLAYSVSSWAMATGHPTIFHDLLNIDSRTYFILAFVGCSAVEPTNLTTFRQQVKVN
jgi:hypothetical protein